MVDYFNYTVRELRDILRGRGLPVSGRKAELVEELVEWDSQFLQSGDSLDITENVRNGSDLSENIYLHPQSFGGYGYMEYIILKSVVIDGEVIQEPEKYPTNWGTNWDVRDANSAINILHSKMKDLLQSPYIDDIYITEASFINPGKWGE